MDKRVHLKGRNECGIVERGRRGCPDEGIVPGWSGNLAWVRCSQKMESIWKLAGRTFTLCPNPTGNPKVPKVSRCYLSRV